MRVTTLTGDLAGATLASHTLAEPVDLSAAFLVCSASVMSTAGPDFSVVRARFADASTVQVSRVSSTNNVSLYTVLVIEVEGATVQTVEGTYLDGVTSTTVAINAVDIATAFVVVSNTSTDSTAGYDGIATLQAEVFDATTLRLYRPSTLGGDCAYTAFVIEP